MRQCTRTRASSDIGDSSSSTNNSLSTPSIPSILRTSPAMPCTPLLSRSGETPPGLAAKQESAAQQWYHKPDCRLQQYCLHVLSPTAHQSQLPSSSARQHPCLLGHDKLCFLLCMLQTAAVLGPSITLICDQSFHPPMFVSFPPFKPALHLHALPCASNIPAAILHRLRLKAPRGQAADEGV